ncbi:piwi-like protein Ago3 isoform X2 [Anabrus simplex]|uniref:piwi-like protein Ago3 isoform X2 n=1 Tax=Anabrus simplex TaxID=316456 RepID=UPI0035A2DFE7
MSGSGGAGRGGRGAALLEALRAQGSRPGSKPEEPPTSAAGSAAPSPGPSGGRGRASLVALLASQKTETPQSPVKEEPSVPRPTGRGRASLLASLAKAPQPEPELFKKDARAETPEAGTSRTSESWSSRTSVTSVTRSFSQASLEERPPIKMHGSDGKQIDATANYIPLIVEPGKGVFEYEVRFNPDLDAKKLRFQLLNRHMDDLGGCKTFDGVTLYLPIKLQQQTTVFECEHPVDKTNVTMTIQFRRQKRLGECIHLYNVLFRRIMNVLELAHIGRQHFNPHAAHKIPQHKLEIWPGYVTAVDEYEGGIQLCCDSSHRVLRQQTVLQCIEDISTRQPQAYKEEVQKLLIGASVLTRYNNKTYRVDDIMWDQNPSHTFTSSSGEQLSFMDYYKKQYDLRITDPGQPLLLSRVKTKMPRGKSTEERMICLVPELCYMTGLTDAMRSDFRVMKDIAVYTRITPNQRMGALKKFIANIHNSPKAMQLLADWGLKLAPSPTQIKARQLMPEDIMFGNNVQCKGSPQADWGGMATRNYVLTGVDLINWIVVHVQKDTRYASDFAMMMKKISSQMGIQIAEPKMRILRDDRTESYLRCLRENINPQLQVAVIICPTARDDRYSAVKKLCCTESPVASQVINSRTLSKPDKLRSVVQKIALQINCKLGGTLWAVKIPLDNCMVCGIDTYHTATGRGKSVGAFVASMNKLFTRWYSQVCFQGPQEELISGMKSCFTTALRQYYEVNHRFPERIVIYRDGVGDGQLMTALKHEVPQFESVFHLIKPDYKPSLTIVICQKRINTRIFTYAHEQGDELVNPGPGTVVDHSVTRRDWYDFFLVSQHVRQGTVSPTHYIVIYDTSKMKTDHVQRLTYKLCHLYYNWPGTVRVPAPCQVRLGSRYF